MAIYRLHRREWDKGKSLLLPSSEVPGCSDLPRTPKKRKHPNGEGDNDPSGGGRKGLSSGLSTVVRRSDSSNTKNTSALMLKKKTEWWAELGSSKGSLRIS